MPDNQLPQVPNWVPGQGALATYRLDFEKHVTGSAFRHTAGMIDLLPTLVIGGNTVTDVQDALAALLGAINPFPILATATTPGLVQLSVNGDVQGTATLLRVTGLRGYPISNAPPITGNVLSWNGSSWIPSASSSNFNAGGDLAGGTLSQQVIGLTGTGTSPNKTVRASNDILQFIASAHPLITQAYVTGANAGNLAIEAQGVAGGSGSGGSLLLLGGKTNNSLAGGVNLSVGGSPNTEGGEYLFQVTQVVPNQVVTAFFPSNPTGLTSADMPLNTGSDVIYIGDTTTPPTAPSSTGSILWSQGGQLNIMQENGAIVTLGVAPNPNAQPSSIGTTVYTGNLPSNGSITFVNTATSTTNVGVAALTFPVPINCALRMDVTYIAKQLSSFNIAELQYSYGVARGTSSPIFLGSALISQINNGSIGNWTLPSTPNIGPTTIEVLTGFAPATSIVWTITTIITIVSA
jgi:hypothetical protein